MPDDVRSATAYLIVEPPKWKYDPPRIAGMRKEKPALTAGQVAVKIVLRIPMEMFNEFIPEAIAEVEAQNFIAPVVELGLAEEQA